MNAPAVQQSWPLVQAARQVAAGLALLATVGCAVLPTPIHHTNAPREVIACSDWFAALDALTDSQGVRDAGASRVPGFAQLRLDRFTASLPGTLSAQPGQDGLAAQPQAATALGSAQAQAALVQRMQHLDMQARSYEIANLTSAARMGLAANAALDPGAPALLHRTHDCAQRLSNHDLASPARMASLPALLQVPDDYATSARLLGLYALTRLPFVAGVRRHEAQRQAVFAQAAPPAPTGTLLRLAPPTPASAQSPASSLTPSRLARMLAPAPHDPFKIPAPSVEDLALLYAHYAPRFVIDVASSNDQPGALAWQGDAVVVDTRTPVLYRQLTHTRYGTHTLAQLVYTLWFPARPPAPGNAPDLLAGALDGLVIRVTLAPNGTVLVVDSMHPCGCYHEFYPTPAATAKAAPGPLVEWAFSPQSLPAFGPQDQIVIHVAPRTHYIDRIGIEPVQHSNNEGKHYAWRDYDSLRSLPVGESMPTTSTPRTTATSPSGAPEPQRRSVFGSDGFIAGTDRTERYLFWPMGIARAGSMRQWSRHATAFVGRRHFDDARLMEQRFDFDLSHFRSLAQ